MRRFGTLVAGIAVCVLAACGGEPASDAPASDDTPAASPAESSAQVRIASPMEGMTVTGPSVTVVLEASGFSVVPAGDMTPNSGHHHLFLDRDVSALGVPIPVEEGFIVHIGTGGAEVTFESVTPGEHRLIAVVGDAVHVPVQPLISDTIHFTVR